MGKGGGGGGGQPQTTTAYQTNLPEYAQPYVMSMLGAAQNQLFNTSGSGPDAQITGFKPYTPYSSDPTQYFAAPTSLQKGVYNEAAGMQTPGQYAPATGLAGVAGMGQLGAGADYTRSATDPSRISAFMSPYQQAVTDVAKNAAIREAQLAQQATNLGAARQGTYGGARQALMQGERERNLLTNLSNIQAQGSQAAFDKAMQAQQFGANLGLQGLQGAASTAGTLANIGGQQQQSDLARMGFQQQTGAQQQAFQQNIINQAIQDYATQQQYPYMQLSTMSNLLRGLPMQGMSTQQYQAQPSTTQQLLGLAGTGASLYGAMGRREGGAIKEYKAGGSVGLGYANRGVVDSTRDRLEEMFEQDAEEASKYVAQSSSPAIKKLARELGIGAAPTGKLGRNMAGGGIIAFGDGGDVPGYYDGDLIEGFGTNPEAAAMDQMRVDEAQLAEKRKRYEQVKAMSPVAAERMLANDPSLEAKAAVVAPAAAPIVKKDEAAPAAPAAAPANAATEYNSPTGLAAVLAERKKLLGVDGPGEKSEAFMKALEERQAGMGKEREADRYLRMAEAFSKFGSTAGPMASVASQALGGFAKGEAAARRDEDKMKLEGMKMQADLEKARRAEERGDLDAAEKFYSSAEDRRNRLETANISAGAAGQTARFEKDAVERIMKEEGVSFAQALERVRGAGRSEGIDMQIGKEAYKAAAASVAPGGSNAKKYKELMKEDPTGALAKQFVTDLAQEQIRGMKAVMGMGSGSKGASGNIDTSNPLLK
jgi:hypothetical protein